MLCLPAAIEPFDGERDKDLAVLLPVNASSIMKHIVSCYNSIGSATCSVVINMSN